MCRFSTGNTKLDRLGSFSIMSNLSVVLGDNSDMTFNGKAINQNVRTLNKL
jgi:hypothetical protein